MHTVLTYIVVYLLVGLAALVWVSIRVGDRPHKFTHWVLSLVVWPLLLWVVMFNVD